MISHLNDLFMGDSLTALLMKQHFHDVYKFLLLAKRYAIFMDELLDLVFRQLSNEVQGAPHEEERNDDKLELYYTQLPM